MEAIAEIELSNPQFDFIECDKQYPGFVGGFGSGKTFAGVCRATYLKFEYPTLNVGYYLPTYDLIDKIGFPRFEEFFTKFSIPYTKNEQKKKIVLNGGEWGEIIFRTLDKPERIIGYEHADAIVDELDTLPTNKARDCWRKIIARNRQKKPDRKKNTIGVATTPEGFRFVYEQWKDAPPNDQFVLIHSATSENLVNLPDGYIDDLYDQYPSNLVDAYLKGLFVNLTSGSVYPMFDRKLNGSNQTVQHDAKSNTGEALHIGMDFNVTKMAAIVHVLRDNDIPHAVDELCNVFDTPAMIKLIKERYQDRGHEIFVYPDASGEARDSNNASESDLKLLRQAKFGVCNNTRNPRVRDRVISMNVRFNRAGERRYFVNAAKCPHYVKGLETQIYDPNGEPDKKAGVDHPLDAGGYFINYRYPIVRKGAIVTNNR